MVQVYSEPFCRRHHSPLLSGAVLVRLVTCMAAIVLSFLLAYATGGFWRKLAHEVRQPTVHYSGDALMILESTVPGQEQVWTTSPALKALLPSNYLPASVQVSEEDPNQDGKPDLIRFVARANSPTPVHSVKLLLQFSYSLQGAALLKMYGLAYLSASSPAPGAGFSADGELLLRQAAPLRASSVALGLSKPLLDSSALLDGSAVQGDLVLQLGRLFESYQARNLTTVFDNRYPVWKAGSSQEFTVEARVRIPPHQVHTYRPGVGEMLKWGWVQFAATFWLLNWLASCLLGLLFGQRVLETRVISDLQPRMQKY